jgi:hypothetical protein
MLWTITFNSTIFSMFTMHRTIIIKKLHTPQSQQFSDKKTPTLTKTKIKLLDQTKKEKIQKLIEHKKNQFIDSSNENHHEIHHKTDPIDHPYSVYLYWKEQKKE